MKIEIMARDGHQLLAEIREDTSLEELRWVDHQLRQFRQKGYSTFTRSGQRVNGVNVDLDEDLVLIAPLVGG